MSEGLGRSFAGRGRASGRTPFGSGDRESYFSQRGPSNLSNDEPGSVERGWRGSRSTGRNPNSNSRGRGSAGASDHRYHRGKTERGTGQGRGNAQDGNRAQRGGRGRGDGGRKEYTPRPMTYGRLKTWAETEDSAELLLFISSEWQQVKMWLDEDKIKEDWFTLFVKALDHSFNAQHQREAIRHLIGTLNGSRFFEHFTMYLTEKQMSLQPWQDAEGFFKSIMRILEEILDKMPHFAVKCVNATSHLLNCLPSDSMVLEDQDIRDNLRLLSQRAKEVYSSQKEKELRSQRQQLVETDDSDVPPDNFTELSVVPTESDLEDKRKPFVRSAIVKGVYQDTLHYLDVQFRLMKADFILPLRNGLAEYKEKGCRENFSCSDIRLYFDVQIINIVYGDGIDHILQFDVSKLKRVRWEFSKRLIFGSLVCLSKDNFKTVFFATITGRDRKGLAEGYVNVNFKSGLDEIFNSTTNDFYIMAETTAYFESYSHVLEGLQEMVSNLPLQDYIVACKKVLKPPRYLLPSGGVSNLPEYDIHFMMKDGRQKTVPVLTTVKWPKADDMCLNESQREAAQLALTKEMAIIQGPPGTGKTYVGLKVMQALIKNKHMISSNNGANPILVVCYTNHALDQFLEGVLEFCKDGIVRVGGKNDSPVLEPFSMRALKQKLRKEQALNSISVRRKIAECLGDLKRVWEEIELLHKTMNNLSVDIKTEDILENHMKPQHFNSLHDDKPDHRYSKSVMRIWLNASSSNPSTIIPRMIELHLTKLALMWTQPSENTKIHSGMNIIDRVKLYCLLRLTVEDELCRQYGYQSGMQRHPALQVFLSSFRGRILQDYELGLRGKFLAEMKKQIESQNSKEIIPEESVVKYWLLGLHRGLHKQLDDIEMLTNALNGEQEDTDYFDDGETSAEAQRARIIDDNDEEEEDLNYEQKTQNAKNSMVSIMQRVEKLGIEEITLDEDADGGGWQTVSNSKPLSFHRIMKKLRGIKPMSEDEESRVTNVWQLDHNKRFALYNLWIVRYKEKLTQRMRTQVHHYKSAYEMKKEVNREEDLHLLRNAQVIGMTTTGAAKHRAVLQAVGCRIIVVEEAAEVLESHIVTALNKNCQHLILIGDHQQLRPSPTVYELAKDFGLEISLFERLLNNGVPHVVLKEQHRMRPEISQLMRHIYPDLQDHDSVHHYENIAGVAKNVFFIQHKEMEEKVDDTRSKANKYEAKYLVALCQYLTQQGYKSAQITILATYAGQVLAIKKSMKENFQLPVRVTAVDNFQGEENDIILLSLVRSNSQNSVGFLKVDNRVCVALSRAKKGLYVIGNIDSLASQSKLWSNIHQTAKEHKIIGDGLPVICQNHPEFKNVLISPEDFKKCPEGGCGRPCDYRLTCGHVCAKTCHGYDRDHTQYQCKKRCTKTCKDGHPCLKKCFQPCGDCTVAVVKTIPSCGHESEVPCYTSPDKAICRQRCPALLDCEHPCPGTCGECGKQNKHKKCTMNVQYAWPCGHICKVPCYMKPSLYLCQSECGAVLDCGHKCTGKCAECLRGAVHKGCSKTCDKILPCGHRCSNYCGVPCLPCTVKCPGKCRHSSCAKSKAATDCGDACIPCKEKCRYGCRHNKCTKLCFETCDVQPCNEKCLKKLEKCKHVCAGLCGEVCVCAKCDKVLMLKPKQENVAETERGSSSEKENTNSEELETQEKSELNESSEMTDSEETKNRPGKLIIKIPSCSHIFLVSELDQYVNSFDIDGSKYIECPECQRPILNCWRYENINKERSKRREEAKTRLRMQNDVTRDDVAKIKRSVKQIENSSLLSRFRLQKDAEAMNKIEIAAKSFQLKCAFILKEIDSQEINGGQIVSLRDYLLKIDNRLTEQQKHELIRELSRFYWLSHLTYLRQQSDQQNITLPQNLEQDVCQSIETLEHLKPDQSKIHRTQVVAQILLRRVTEMVKEPNVKAKCMLLEESSTRVVKILQSKEDEMLCDLLKNFTREEDELKLTSDLPKLRYYDPVTRGVMSLGSEHTRKYVSAPLSERRALMSAARRIRKNIPTSSKLYSDSDSNSD